MVNLSARCTKLESIQGAVWVDLSKVIYISPFKKEPNDGIALHFENGRYVYVRDTKANRVALVGLDEGPMTDPAAPPEPTKRGRGRPRKQ